MSAPAESDSRPPSPGEPARPAARERCWTCYKPRALCLCGRVPRVGNRTRVTILQHPRERFHPIGTARLAWLGLENAEILRPRSPVTRSLAVPHRPAPGAGLLFPRAEARDLADLPVGGRPSELIVLDGTWGQARKLYRANPWLAELPHYALSPEAPTRYRIRRAPRASYVSTIEAIVGALRILEPATPGLEGLLEAFDRMIDEQAAYSHRAPRRPVRKLRRQGRL